MNSKIDINGKKKLRLLRNEAAKKSHSYLFEI